MWSGEERRERKRRQERGTDAVMHQEGAKMQPKATHLHRLNHPNTRESPYLGEWAHDAAGGPSAFLVLPGEKEIFPLF